MLAGAVLTTSAIYAVMAQVLTTDMLLTATMTTAMYAFFLHWRYGGNWCWFFYVAMGLAVLDEGPGRGGDSIARGHDIPRGVKAICAARMQRFRVIPGIILVAAIAAPWFVAITIREPGFFDFYFIGEHFRRFFDANYSHDQPPYYYVPILIGGLMPWTLAVPFIPWRRLTPNPARRFCCYRERYHPGPVFTFQRKAGSVHPACGAAARDRDRRRTGNTDCPPR